ACILLASNTSSILLLPRIGPRALIVTGMLLGGGAMTYLTQLTVTSSYAVDIVPALVAMGLGFGMIFAPAINTATAGVARQDSGVASALVNTMQQVGGSIGTAALSTVALTATASYLTAHHAGRLAPVTAAVHGYTVAFAVSAVLFGVGALAAVLLLPLQAAEDFGPAALVDVDDLPGDGLIMPCGGVGAPLVGLEKIEAGDEGERLRSLLERHTGRTVTALMAGEIGGSNGLVPVTWAARMGLPVVDADGMGRAFPLVSQVTMELAGISPCPAVMTDERGNVVVFRAISGDWVERLERAAAAEFGGLGQATDFPLTAAQAREATVRGSVSQAIRIGEAAANAPGSPVAAVIEAAGAFRLAGGKVLDVRRDVSGGFTRGSVVIEGLAEDAGRLIRLEQQNEHLVALERGRLLASVPDLITVLDSETADAVSAERISYGQRVVVIA